MGEDTWRKLSLICQGSYLWLSSCPCQPGSTCCLCCWTKSTAIKNSWMLLFLSSFFFCFFNFFFIFPGTCCCSSTTDLLSLKAPFNIPLAPAAGFKQMCQLGVLTQTQVNHTLLAKWSSGIHLQRALAGQPPQTLLLCKGKVGWWLIRVYNRSQVVLGIWNLPFRSLLLLREHHSFALGTWWKIRISRCRTEEASITLHRNQTPQFIFWKETSTFGLVFAKLPYSHLSKEAGHSQVVGALESNVVFTLHTLHKLQTVSRARNSHFIQFKLILQPQTPAEDLRQTPDCTGLWSYHESWIH